ncbi:MAG: ABC transporter permease [bacterium]|nr:ABC transporter permease [bacterium]MBU1917924.1 ABC transporter permease [bacterium]
MTYIPFLSLINREAYRFLRLFSQTVLPPVLLTLLFILVFGYSLGSSIKKIQGFDYIIFILPGLAQMGVIQHAYQNSATSFYLARMERSIENFLVAPLSYLQIISSFIIGSILRGLTVGICILIMSSLFVDFPIASLTWLFLSWFVTAALFGALGILVSMLAESWDHVALISNFILMPLIYLGGVFYSIKMLPPFWQKISLFNPVFYAIDSTRYALLGKSEFTWYLSFLLILIMALLLLFTCTLLFKRGFKIIN